MKRLLVYTSILLGVGYLSSKAKEIYNDFSLSFDIKHLRFLEINATTLSITFLADIIIKNTSGIPIYAPVRINNIEFFLYGKKIGEALIYKDSLYIPTDKPLLLKDVQIDLIFKDYKYLYEAFTNMKQPNLEYKINYSIAGNQFSYTGIYQP